MGYTVWYLGPEIWESHPANINEVDTIGRSGVLNQVLRNGKMNLVRETKYL